MSRRRRAEKREILPDPKFKDLVVSKFMNNLMLDGKKSVSEKIVYGAFDEIESKMKRPPLEIFHEALDNIKPSVEVRSIKVPAIQDSLALATAIRDSLDLFGYVSPRQTYIDQGILYTRVQHLGKRHDLKVDIGKGEVEIEVSKRSFIAVLSGLHVLGEVLSGAPWHIKAWKYYQLATDRQNN